MEENTGELYPQIDNSQLYRKFGEKLTRDLFESGYVKVTQEDGEKLEELTVTLEDNEDVYIIDVTPSTTYISRIIQDDEQTYVMDAGGIYARTFKRSPESDSEKVVEGAVFEKLSARQEQSLLNKLLATDSDVEMTKNMNFPRDIEKQGAVYYRVNVHDSLPFPLPFPERK